MSSKIQTKIRKKSRFPLNRKRDFSTIYPSLVEKPVNSSALLVGGNHDLQAAHIRLQHFGDGHGAVGLQMVLQEGDQHTRRCHAGVIQETESGLYASHR